MLDFGLVHHATGCAYSRAEASCLARQRAEDRAVRRCCKRLLRHWSCHNDEVGSRPLLPEIRDLASEPSLQADVGSRISSVQSSTGNSRPT